MARHFRYEELGDALSHATVDAKRIDGPSRHPKLSERIQFILVIQTQF
jgi:hypothetical protein